jgi:SulP family sulfate permease
VVFCVTTSSPCRRARAGPLFTAFQVPLSFLNADLFRHDLAAALDGADRQIRLVVLEASSIVEIDYSAALALREAIEKCRKRGIDFAGARLKSIRAQEAFERFGVMKALGPERLFHSVDEATKALIAQPPAMGS